MSSAADMTRYLSAQLDGGAYNGGSILSPASVLELHRPAASTGNHVADDPPETIANSVAGLLLGDPRGQSDALGSIYLVFDGIAILSLTLALASLVRLERGRTESTPRSPWTLLRRVILPLLSELLLPAGLLGLMVLPLLGPLPVLLMYAPDVTWWLLAVCVTLLATGATRIVLAVAGRRTATAARVAAARAVSF